MAIVITVKSVYSYTTDVSSMVVDTAYTPAANSLSVVFVCNSLAASPLDPTTVTGHGVSYSQVSLGSRLLSTTHTVSLWVAKMGASPTNAKVTADFSGVTQTGGIIAEYEVTGADVTGTALQAIVQSPTSSGTNGTSRYTWTNGLAAAADSNNRAVAGWFHLANEGGGNGTAGNWTQDWSSLGFNTPPTAGMVQHCASVFDRSPSNSWASNVDYFVVAAEIKIAPAAGGFKVNPLHGRIRYPL